MFVTPALRRSVSSPAQRAANAWGATPLRIERVASRKQHCGKGCTESNQHRQPKDLQEVLYRTAQALDQASQLVDLETGVIASKGAGFSMLCPRVLTHEGTDSLSREPVRHQRADPPHPTTTNT